MILQGAGCLDLHQATSDGGGEGETVGPGLRNHSFLSKPIIPSSIQDIRNELNNWIMKFSRFYELWGSTPGDDAYEEGP